MNNLLLTTLLGSLVIASTANWVAAQDPKTQPPTEWTERYDRMFLERAPLLNEEAPDVAAYQQNGEPFQLSSTRGKYTVLVFGCLT